MQNIEVVTELNKILANELVAINQYFFHSKLLKNWGFSKLAAKSRKDSIDEMNHADILFDRILFLEGKPAMKTMTKINIGDDIIQMLKNDLKLEDEAVVDLKQAIRICENHDDFASRDLLGTILASEEEHVDWLGIQLQLIKSIGLGNYLQSQV